MASFLFLTVGPFQAVQAHVGEMAAFPAVAHMDGDDVCSGVQSGGGLRLYGKRAASVRPSGRMGSQNAIKVNVHILIVIGRQLQRGVERCHCDRAAHPQVVGVPGCARGHALVVGAEASRAMLPAGIVKVRLDPVLCRGVGRVLPLGGALLARRKQREALGFGAEGVKPVDSE